MNKRNQPNAANGPDEENEVTPPFTLKVRDYELDAYGVVNHANYLNYMEEARKHYLTALGFDFKALLKKQVGFVVASYEIDYLRPLFGGDEIMIDTVMERVSRLKFQFLQNIYLIPGKLAVVKARNIVIPVNSATSRPQWSDELDPLLVAFPLPENKQS